MKDFVGKAHYFNENTSLLFNEMLVTVGGMPVEEEGIVGEVATEAIDAVGRQGRADAMA